MSIKKKFVTAVATAGLLAGLFGSALVPSALARGIETPVSARTHIKDNTNELWRVGSGVGYNQRDGDHSGRCKADKPTYDCKDSWTQYMFDNRYDSGFDEPNNDLSLGFSLFGSDKGAGHKDWNQITTADLTATSSSSAIEVAWAYAADKADQTVSCESDYIADAFGTSDSVIGVGGTTRYMSHLSHSDQADETLNDNFNNYYLCIAAKSYKTPGTATITVTANGVTLPKVTVRALGDLASLTVAPVGSTLVSEGNNEVDRFIQVIGKDAAGQVINDNDQSLSQWGDADAISLNEWTENDLDDRGTDSNELVVNEQDDEISFLDDGANEQYHHTVVNGYKAWSEDLYTLDSDVCVAPSYTGATDGSAGKSYDFGVELENYQDSRVIESSNAVTITCTGSVYTATVSDLAPLAFSGKPEADDDADLKHTRHGGDAIHTRYYIMATFKDKFGKTLGLGGDTAGFGSFDFYTEDDATSLDAQAFNNVGVALQYTHGLNSKGMAAVGRITPTDELSNNKMYAFTIATDCTNFACSNADRLEAEVTFSSTLGDTYAITKVWSNGHKTLTASVDFGYDCSSDTVTFSYEKKNGDTASVNRRASLNGVATLVMTRSKMTTFIDAACGYDYYAPLVRARFK